LALGTLSSFPEWVSGAFIRPVHRQYSRLSRSLKGGAVEAAGDYIERRVERVQFETDRHRIVGNVTLPPEGYQSRFSVSLKRPDVEFIPVVNVEITPLDGGETVHREFCVVGKEHIRIAFPLEEVR
jgi:hypothetical protein